MLQFKKWSSRLTANDTESLPCVEAGRQPAGQDHDPSNTVSTQR